MFGWFLVLTAAFFGAHLVVLAYFIASKRWVERNARERGLPDWMIGRSARNGGRVVRFVAGGAASVAVAAGLGAMARGSAWWPGVAGFAVGFNLVALVVEGAAIVAERRLFAEMRAQVDRVLPG